MGGFAQNFQNRFHFVKQVAFAASHNPQAAVGRFVFAAKNRRIQKFNAFGGVSGRFFAGGVRVNSGHIDDNLTGLDPGQHAGFAKDQRVHGLVVAEAVHHHVCAGNRLGGGCGLRGSLRHQRSAAVGGAIPDGDGITGFEQISGHAPTHNT